jgi:hypothetical protein
LCFFDLPGEQTSSRAASRRGVRPGAAFYFARVLAYIKSQAHEGWRLVKGWYDDGGLSGGTLERPALKSLLDDIRARKVDVVVVYKVDRLTRSLADLENWWNCSSLTGSRSWP